MPFFKKYNIIGIVFLVAFVCTQFLPLTAHAATSTNDFSTSTDYTFDSSKIEFSSGQAQLKVTGTPAWYSASWTKRKTVTITGSSAGAQTNYQVKITVPYDSDMQADFDDIRFTSSDGITLISHWLESKTDSSTADFWVEVPSIPISPGTVVIYMYYGNSAASSSSSGRTTFISGTDFVQDDGFTFRDNGTNESYNDSSGQIRSNNGQLSLIGIDRISDSYVANNKRGYGMNIVSSVVSHTTLDGPEDVLVDGDYAYIPTRDGGKLSVYNISNPASPVFVSSFTDSDLTQAMGVAKNGNTLYLTSWHNHKLLILNAADPSNITKISSISIGTTEGGGDPDELRKVFYLDGYAYVTHSHDEKLYIVDVSNPASPSITGSVATGDGAFAVFVKGNYAYVGGCFVGSSLKVIDISNKAAPSIVKTLSSSNYSCTGGFANSGNNLYAVYYTSNTFVTFDISDPANTTQTGILSNSLLSQPNRLYVYGNVAYVASSGGDAIVQINITTPTNPTLSFITTSTLLDRAYGVMYYGGKVFAVGRDADSLVVLDPSVIDEVAEDVNVSVSNNFSVRSKFRLTAATAGAWLPLTSISADGSPINQSTNSFSLNAIWQNSTLQLIEFFGVGATYYKQAASAVTLSLGTTYISELKKVGSNATLSIYQTNGTLVGSSVISSLTNSNINYKWLMPYQNVANNVNWITTAKTSTQDIYFSFLRNYVTPEPTYSIGSEVALSYPADNPTIQPNAATAFTSLSGFAETSTLNSGEIKYQISNNNGTTWYWYNSGWTATTSSYTEASTATQINTSIATFPVGSGQFLFRAYLHSDGTQLVKLDTVALTYINDTTPPTVSVTAPTASATVSGGTVSLTATASDNIGVVGVQFKVDGVNNGAEDTTSFYGVIWDSTGVSDGSHVITAVARDLAGNSTTSSSVTVTVDNTAPVRSAGSPSTALAFGTTATTLSLTTNENATCKYGTVSGTAYGSILSTFSITGTTAHSASLTGLTNATSYTYYVRCQDGQSNVNSTDYTISFSVAADVTNPTVSITAPAASATVSGSSVSVTADASDNDTVAGVSFYDGVTFIGVEDTVFPYTVTWNTTSVSDGTHTLSAIARDSTGNTTTSGNISVTVHNSVVVNVQAPAGSVGLAFLPPSQNITPTTSGFCKIDDLFNTTTGKPCTSFLPVQSICPLLPSLPKVLKVNMTHASVRILQQILNCKGYSVSGTGPGSLGQETSYFGFLTKQAVIRFQTAKGLVSDGVVGEETRRELGK